MLIVLAAVLLFVRAPWRHSGSSQAAQSPPVAAGRVPVRPPASLAPTSGPGVTTAGTVVVAQPEGNGFRVFEESVLPASPPKQLTLTVPDVGRLGTEIDALAPGVSDLRIALDGRPVAVRATGDGRWIVALSAKTHHVVASYLLEGALHDTRSATTGRALGLVTPLVGAPLRSSGSPLVVHVVGPRIRGVVCPDAPAALLLCGTEEARGWSADVPASENPVVLVQLDRSRSASP